MDYTKVYVNRWCVRHLPRFMIITSLSSPHEQVAGLPDYLLAGTFLTPVHRGSRYSGHRLVQPVSKLIQAARCVQRSAIVPPSNWVVTHTQAMGESPLWGPTQAQTGKTRENEE